MCRRSGPASGELHKTPSWAFTNVSDDIDMSALIHEVVSVDSIQWWDVSRTASLGEGAKPAAQAQERSDSATRRDPTRSVNRRCSSRSRAARCRFDDHETYT